MKQLFTTKLSTSRRLSLTVLALAAATAIQAALLLIIGLIAAAIARFVIKKILIKTSSVIKSRKSVNGYLVL